MMPTLVDGDFIIVNKFAYGLRLPVINQKVLSLGEPQRGGRGGISLPAQSEHQLHQASGRRRGRPGAGEGRPSIINGQPVPRPIWGCMTTVVTRACTWPPKHWANTLTRSCSARPPETSAPIRCPPATVIPRAATSAWHSSCRACRTAGHAAVIVVPPASYLMIGDNRDNSEDGRIGDSCLRRIWSAKRPGSGSIGIGVRKGGPVWSRSASHRIIWCLWQREEVMFKRQRVSHSSAG